MKIVGVLVIGALLSACLSNPTGSDGRSTAIAIAAGEGHSCALTATGDVWCWGDGRNGQLGVDSLRAWSPRQVPVAGMTALVAGWESSCGIRGSGQALLCWGAIPGEAPTVAPTDPVPGAVAEDASISLHAVCIVEGSSGHVICLGSDSYGAVSGSAALAEPSYPERYSAVVVAPLSICVVSDAGAAFCWGDNDIGQIREDTVAILKKPLHVADNVSSIAIGRSFTCAIDTSGRLQCWGPGATSLMRTVETLGERLGELRGIAIGRINTWVLNTRGEVWPLTPLHPQYGIAEPRRFNPTFRASRIVAGFSHACALADDGDVWCWGPNGDGQVGTGLRRLETIPVRVFP